MILDNKKQKLARNHWIGLQQIWSNRGVAAFLLITAICGEKSPAQVVANSGETVNVVSPVVLTINDPSVQLTGLDAEAGGTITGNNVTVSVSNSAASATKGAYANGAGATISLTGGGSVQASDGLYSAGLICDNGGMITETNLAVTSTATSGGATSDAYGVYVRNNGGEIDLIGGSVQAQANGGQGSFGLEVDPGGGTITANDVAISATNASNADAVVAFGGTINLTGGSVEANGTSLSTGLDSRSDTTITANDVAISAESNSQAVGVSAYGTNATVVLTGGSVSASGSGYVVGLYADYGGAITGTNLTVTSSSEGVEIDDGSSLTLNTSSITASGSNAIQMYGGTVGTANTIVINGGTLSSSGADLIYADGAVSDITLNSVTTGASEGHNLLSIVDASTVSFTADQGSKLTGDIVVDATSSANISLLNDSVLTGAINGAQVNVLIDPSVWNVTGDSSIATLNNQGSLVFAPPSGGAFKTVTVSGLYSGSSGSSITFNTFLNNGSTQETDKLVVGSTAGTTTVFVRNVGGPGGVTGTSPTSGIQLVDVTGGAAASNGNFVLGQRVVAGLFDYSLVKADGQNWYLQTDAPLSGGGTPIIGPGTVSPEIPTIASFNTLGLLTGQAQLDTLQFRLGEYHRLDTDATKSSELWGRGYYNEDNLHTGDFGAARVDIGGTQVGGDLRFKDVFTQDDRLYLGGFAEYANAQGSPYAGKTTLDSYGAGLYATYYHQGWYVDAIFKGDYNDYHAYVPSDPEMSTSGYGLAGSLEGGYQFDLGHGWAVEPQAQLTYQYEEIDSMNDRFGRTYNFNQPQTLDGRLGVKVENSFLLHDGRRITPYLRTSVVHDMLDNNSLTVDSVTVDTPYGGTSAMFDGGITVNLTKNIDLYVSGILVAGTKEDSTGVSGGVRFAW